MIQIDSINNPLFEKVFIDDLKGIKKLLESLQGFYEKKKRVNGRDGFKRTALFYSLYYSSFDTIEYLIANGADTLFLDFKGRTVLHYAVIL